MLIYDGRRLLDMQRSRSTADSWLGESHFVIREWDGALSRVQVTQVLGSPRDRFTQGVEMRYRDGLTHRVSLAYFCGVVVGLASPSTWSAYGRLRAPRVTPWALTAPLKK